MARTLIVVTNSWQSIGIGPLCVSIAEMGNSTLLINSAEDEDTAAKTTKQEGSTFDCRAAVEYFAKATEVNAGWKIIVDTDL